MRCPFAQWQGSPNEYVGGMDAEPMGVVLHIEQGSEQGTVATFHNPGAQASAHFGVGKDGHVDQFVDTKDAAWAEVAGNRHWISIEHEGLSGESLTTAQLESTSRIIAWLKGHEGGPGFTFPLRITDDVNQGGLGWHGMGGTAWGGHFNCPGDPIKSQRQSILTRVSQFLGQPAPAPEPTPVPHVAVPNFPGRLLRNFTQGGDVLTWQKQMAHRGWSIVTDGKYGPKSENICRQFQSEKHLSVDGVVGPVTWAASWTAPIT